jgi:hypothetical protein
LSIKQHPSGLKLDFGSTVTILTTAVADTKHCRRVNGQGIFTGVVLEESELRLKRSSKHVLISVDGLSELQNDSKKEVGDCCCHEIKHDDKKNDWEEHKSHYQKSFGEHKNDYEHEVKTMQEFVILSLTCSSFPFLPGQIVWISIDQIIALTVLCKN